MSGFKDRLSEWVQRWASFIVRQETSWRETLRSEGAEGEDVVDIAPKAEASSCSTKPESPSLMDEAAKRRGQVRHRD